MNTRRLVLAPISARLAAAAAVMVLVPIAANAPGNAAGPTAPPPAGTVLGIKDTRFTLNGQPTFLLGISYYGALGASEAFVRSDLDDLQRHGFNWLRVWATWGAFDHDVSAVDAQGGPREPFLGRLRWLVAECDRRGLVVDVTLTRSQSSARGAGTVGLPDFQAHQRAVGTLIEALRPHRNWYLDLANERDVRDARYVSPAELKTLRELARRLDPQLLVTASFGGHDLTESDVRDALVTAGSDFLAPHRPRDPGSPTQTEAASRACLALAKAVGRVVPVHFQEPFRRGYGSWEPTTADFLTDLRGARAGGAAGWCLHNGSQRQTPDNQPRRSFDLRSQRLFDQLDTEEREVLACVATPAQPLRIIIETDAGGDPDDEQSLVRFLVYANEFDIEGIIANRPIARDRENRNPVRDGLGIVRAQIEAYGKCHPNLVQHDPRFPAAEHLLSRTVAGYDDTDAGVKLIVRAVDADDPRPVWFSNWGTDQGSAESCLQRALDQVLRERGPAGYAEFKSRLRLCSADKFGEHTTTLAPAFPLWVDTFRPSLDNQRWYHRFSRLTATAGGFDLERDVRTGHGPLGALYPTNTGLPQKEGDTMAFLYLVPTGMNDPNEPAWGSWAGRYGPNEQCPGKPYFWANQTDTWHRTTSRDHTLARWAADLQNDFRARLDWCVKPREQANHRPIAVVNGRPGSGILRLDTRPGGAIELSAEGSRDPDGDALAYEWLVYGEAGTYLGEIALSATHGLTTRFTAPEVAEPETIHVILRVQDAGQPALCSYRRVIITVARPANGALDFEKRVLSDKYYCDGINGGDFNRDGKMDVVAGPFWYEGPEFTMTHEIYPPKEFPTSPSPTDSLYSFVHDFNGDGWPDVLVVGRVHLHQAFWYENPQDKPVHWPKHFVHERVQAESPAFADIDQDGRPEIICICQQQWGLLKPAWSAPTQPWTFHSIVREGDWHHFYHGTGVGDVNGDGRPDLLLNDGWWERPPAGRTDWIAHRFKFASKGGAQMFADDVDGDGDNDLITSLDAHGWGLAWFEQLKDGDEITFREHKLMGDRSEEAAFGVAFSQPHALDLADLDGDGLKDVIVGKRLWAHGPKGDVEPEASPVLYWFQLKRERGQVRYVPHLIDDESGVGCQVVAADMNGDGHPDILTVSKLGAFVFFNRTVQP